MSNTTLTNLKVPGYLEKHSCEKFPLFSLHESLINLKSKSPTEEGTVAVVGLSREFAANPSTNGNVTCGASDGGYGPILRCAYIVNWSLAVQN